MTEYTTLITAVAAAIPVIATTILTLRDQQRKKIEAERDKLNKQSSEAVQNLVQDVAVLRERVKELEEEIHKTDKYTRRILNVLARKGILDEVLQEANR